MVDELRPFLRAVRTRVHDLSSTVHLLQAEQQRALASARPQPQPAVDAALSKLAILATQTQTLFDDLFNKSPTQRSTIARLHHPAAIVALH